MTDPVKPIYLPAIENPEQEREWLKQGLKHWLDAEFIPEKVNNDIAQQAAQIFVRQRLEGENDLGALVVAIITEMQAFDFSESFYGEFAIANAVSDLILDSLGYDRCCGQWLVLFTPTARSTTLKLKESIRNMKNQTNPFAGQWLTFVLFIVRLIQSKCFEGYVKGKIRDRYLTSAQPSIGIMQPNQQGVNG